MDKDIKVLFDAISAINEQLRAHLLVSKEFLTFNEACKLFDIKRQTMYKLTHAGAIRFYKPNGKLIYFKRSDIEHWIEKGLLRSKNNFI